MLKLKRINWLLLVLTYRLKVGTEAVGNNKSYVVDIRFYVKKSTSLFMGWSDMCLRS